MVPRDVPPENFKSIPETLKIKKTPVCCFVRSFLFVLLIFCLAAALISGIVLVLEEYKVNRKDNFSEELFNSINVVNDKHELSYKAVKNSRNKTVFIKNKSLVATEVDPCLSSPCLAGASCERHDGTFSCYCPPGHWGKVGTVDKRTKIYFFNLTPSPVPFIDIIIN